jgi:hypothetical protein
MDEAAVLGAISLDKDVDGFHPLNLGQLAMKVWLVGDGVCSRRVTSGWAGSG